MAACLRTTLGSFLPYFFLVSVFFLFLFFPSLKGFADARIEGWLPREESDFVDECGQPAALWHIEYDDQRIGGTFLVRFLQ